LQSNIINDFTNAELEELTQHWILIKEFSSRKVYIRLYKKPIR
jgi:hypothetical protein